MGYKALSPPWLKGSPSLSRHQERGKEGLGAKGKAGPLSSKEEFFPEEIETTGDLLVNPFLRNSMSDL